MKIEDVPQHGGLTAGNREVSYAVNKNGQYTLEPSVGWEAKNIALRQAWEEIVDQLGEAIKQIEAGRKSALFYHMVKNQMDSSLLAHYSGIARWRVKRHLKPTVFNKLDMASMLVYAELFGISTDQLCMVPDSPDLLLAEIDQSEEAHS